MGNLSSKPKMVTIQIKIDTITHEYTLNGLFTVKDLLDLINEYRMQPVLKLQSTTGIDVPLTTIVNELPQTSFLKAVY
jgi:hypothetical protein